jgi:hypothetical protein
LLALLSQHRGDLGRPALHPDLDVPLGDRRAKEQLSGRVRTYGYDFTGIHLESPLSNDF